MGAKTDAGGRLRSIRRQLAVWAVVAGVGFAGLAFAAAAAAMNGTGGAVPLGLGALVALGVFVYLQALRARAAE